jgi:hypothetical protein
VNDSTAHPNIAFVSLFGLTELYLAIAGRLRAQGFRIHWITTNEHWTHRLLQAGYDRGDVLELIYRPGDFVALAEKTALDREIARGEAHGGLTVNQILLMDRFLADRPRRNVNDYVYLYYRDMKRFLRDKNVACLFAEPTNLNDMIAYLVCRELGLRYLSPRDMRYPPRRLVFFDGYTQERVVPRRDGGSAVDGRALIDEFAQSRPTPFYFERLNRQPIIRPASIARSIIRRIRQGRVVSGESLTHYDAGGRLRLTLRRSVNAFYLRRLCRYDDLDDIPGRLVFYGLHVQPENSIDVLGPYVSDQLKLIKDIRRALPFDTALAVKEHPNFLGMKSIRFFRHLRKIPNVSLIRHDVSAFDIYRRAALVVTVSGTAAYEAGMLGIPAVTFSPMYFGGLSSVRYCPSPAALQEDAGPLLNGFQRDLDADAAFMETLVRNSYDAYWTDPLFDPGVLDDANVEKLAQAFTVLLTHECR